MPPADYFTVDPWDKRLAIFVLPVIVLLFYVKGAQHFSFTPDSTYVYLQYAKNLISGNGIGLNPGEPAYGVPGMLWVFLISLGGLIGVDLVVAAKTIDLFIASMALVLFFLVAYESIRDVVVALFATLAFSMNVWYLQWAGSGTEVSLGVALLLATFWFCLRNEYLASIFLAALLFLVRPEAVLLFPLILVDAYLNSTDKLRARKLIAALALLYVCFLLPWGIFAFLKFGSVLPAGYVPGTILAGHALRSFFESWSFADALAVVLLCFSIGFYLLREKDSRESDPGEDDERFYFFRQGIVGLGWCVGLLGVLMLVHRDGTTRDLPLLSAFLVVTAFNHFHHFFAKRFGQKIGYTLIVGITMMMVFQNQLTYSVFAKPGMETYAQGMEFALKPIGKWFGRMTPAETVIATPEAGAIAYYSGRRVCTDAACRADFLVVRSTDKPISAPKSGMVQMFYRVGFNWEGGAPAAVYYTVYQIPRETR
ncbi:MAG TPA: hypothetical protein VKS81_00345 [Bacteroidota bacterium]|nr:hypothetical protein [Bacteroidota bacterium]